MVLCVQVNEVANTIPWILQEIEIKAVVVVKQSITRAGQLCPYLFLDMDKPWH